MTTSETIFHQNLDIPRSVARRFPGFPRLTQDDVHAHALVALWEAANTWDRVHHFRSWAWVKCKCSVKNLVREECKRGLWNVPRNLLINWEDFSVLDRTIQREDRVHDADWWDLALAALSPGEAEVIRLLFLEGERQVDVAARLGVKWTTVGVQYARACRKLRSILANEA